MAITVAWGTKVISVPKADTTLVDIGPPEIRSYDIFELLWKELIALEDDEEGMPFIRAQEHVTSKTLGGITLAHVIEIINGYTVTFEDGQYQVALSGANHNILDVLNANQVSLLSSNSTGLVEAAAAQAIWDELVATARDVGSYGALFGELTEDDGSGDQRFTAKALEAGPGGSGGGFVRGLYKFSTTTVEADPGSGVVRYDNAVPASVTELYIHSVTDNNFNADQFLADLGVGDEIIVAQTDNGANFIRATVSAPTTDNTDWWTVPVTIVDSGTLPGNNRSLNVLLGTAEGNTADAVWDEARDEITVIPAKDASFADKLNFIFEWLRNEVTQDGSTTSLKKDDGTELGTSATSESGGTVTKGKFS